MIQPWLTYDSAKLKQSLVLTISVTVAAKLLGFLRLQQIAIILGVSIYADVLILVLQLIWFIEIVFVSGAVVPTLVAKIYKIDSSTGHQDATAYFLHAAFISSILSLSFAIFINVYPEFISSLIAPGLTEEAKTLFRSFLLISAALPLTLTIVHFLALVNRLLHNGIWYSIPTVITNVVSISGLMVGFYIFENAELAAMLMLGGTVIGTLLVIALQFAVIPNTPRAILLNVFRFDFTKAIRGVETKLFWKGVMALFAATLASEGFLYIDFYFASQLGTGSISLLGYASRLATLSIALIVSSSFALLEPRWAVALSSSAQTAWDRIITRDSLSLVCLLITPISILFFFPSQLTHLIYSSDNFLPETQSMLESLTQIFAFGVLSLGLSYITTKAVIVAGQEVWILVTGILMIFLKAGLNIILLPKFGLTGLALSTTACFLFQSICNVLILKFVSIPISFGYKDFLKLAFCYVVVTFTASVFKPFLEGGESLGLIFACFIITTVNLVVAHFSGLNFSFLQKETEEKAK